MQPGFVMTSIQNTVSAKFSYVLRCGDCIVIGYASISAKSRSNFIFNLMSRFWFIFFSQRMLWVKSSGSSRSHNKSVESSGGRWSSPISWFLSTAAA